MYRRIGVSFVEDILMPRWESMNEANGASANDGNVELVSFYVRHVVC
jgi:hypothetical protein